MKLIFAQGNPGSQYAHTRHNTGFIFADMLAKKWGVEFTKKPKFHADVAELTIQGEKIILVKPTTFYNETGQAARALVDFYKLSPTTDFLVIHDDLSLPFGTIRTREQGSDAGNNGIKSLNSHLGQQYKRIRVGIYSHQQDRVRDTDFVLGTFTLRENSTLPLIFDMAEQFIDGFVSNSFTQTKVSLTPEHLLA